MIDPWTDALPPSLAAFDALAKRAFDRLPPEFRAMCGDVVIHVAEFADEDILDDLDIEDPYDLTGLYEGVDVTRQSMDDPAPLAAHVHLYRQPILAEWIDLGDTPLGELVTHVLVHEIGHHFGLSDETMHAIEDAAG